MAQGFLGDHQRALHHRRADLRVDVGAGDQFAAGILDGTNDFADLARAQRLNRSGLVLDGSAPLLAGQSVPGDGHRLALRHTAQLRLIHVHAHAQPVEPPDIGRQVSHVQVRAGARGEAVDLTGDGRQERVQGGALPRQVQSHFGVLQARARGGHLGAVDQRLAPVFEALDFDLGLADLIVRGLDVHGHGGLFFRQPPQRVVLLLVLLEVETRARQIVFDAGQLRRLAARFERGQAGARLRHLGLAGGHIGRKRGIGNRGQHRTLGHALAFPHRDLAHQAGGFRAHRLPYERLGLAVGGERAHQRFALHPREIHLGRSGFPKDPPTDDRRDHQQQQEQQLLQRLSPSLS